MPQLEIIMKTIRYTIYSLALVFALVAPIAADTIRLKDGSVIRGQVVGFKDQQFTVLIGSGSQGRRSRMIIFIEDVESVEFDSATTAGASGLPHEDARPNTNTSASEDQPSRTIPSANTNTPNRTTTSTPATPSTGPLFFTVRVAVASDNKNNGWTNSALVVKKGQRLRISASGRVSLGGGRYSTPAGDSRISSSDRLISTEPTGALIAVIGDDNDNFFVIGNRREFVAQRDGTLFFALNDSEQGLADNVGVYDVVIEVEAGPSSR
jgi:hypothetical protein